MPVEIRHVQSRKDLLTFIKLPLDLYKSEPYYVPHLIADRKKFLDEKRNPFFQHARIRHFLALRDGTPAGRITGIVNDLHNEFHGERAGFFGFFDCVNDMEIAGPLLDSAIEFVKDQGMETILGPENLSTNDEVGLLIDGFDSLPTIMMTYNPPYYIDLYEKLGLTRAEDLLAYYIDDRNLPSERIQKIVDKLRSRGKIEIRTIRLDDFENELQTIRTIYNSAWSRNWGFVPMTEEEFTYVADDFRKIIDPDLVFLAFVKGEPAGFSLALPDYNPVFKKMNGRLFPLGLLKFLYHTKIRSTLEGLRLITMGVVHQYHNSGLDMIFFVETFNEGIRKGYRWAEISWVLEQNVLMNKAALQMGARPYKKYRIYQKSLIP